MMARSRLGSFAADAMAVAILALAASATAEEASSQRLSIAWEKRFLTIRGEGIAGEIPIHYLEAYCRAGSTDRDWGLTVIPHQSEKVSVSDNGSVITLRDTLADGVVVEHIITAKVDEVDFQVTAHNPTDKMSEAHWAQPCMRVDQFAGSRRDDARELYPEYIRKCFVFLDGKMVRLPTEPWATQARYTPGQVYCPEHVDRNDVNPRPLSKLVPTHGLTGCFSKDDSKIVAVAWEPYQELFQGVIACMHSDFRIGGLAPGETKKIRGKIYVVNADLEKLLARFRQDFPEQFRRK